MTAQASAHKKIQEREHAKQLTIAGTKTYSTNAVEHFHQFLDEKSNKEDNADAEEDDSLIEINESICNVRSNTLQL